MSDKLQYFDPIQITVDGRKFSVDPVEMLRIDYFKIREHLLKYPGDFAWVGSVKEVLSKQVSEAEFDLEILYSKLDSEYRAMKKDVKELKERDVKSYVTLNADYGNAVRNLINLRYLEGKVKAVLASLAKFDSVLIQLSTLFKQENAK